MSANEIEIQSRDYWFKVIEMLQQNWATAFQSGLRTVMNTHPAPTLLPVRLSRPRKESDGLRILRNFHMTRSFTADALD